MISARLNIDKGYLSRILAKFEKGELVSKKVSGNDSRAYMIQLSQKGIDTIRTLIEKSNSQINQLIESLSEKECDDVCLAMDVVKKYFTKATSIRIRPFTQNDIDFVISRHIELYKKEYALTSDIWKFYVKDGVHKLAEKFDDDRDCMYILDYRGIKSGCIAITHTGDSEAQLRFFFVDAEVRGMGMGRCLMDKAVNFCKEKKYKHVFLWTFSKLEAARYLYSKYGFKITEKHENSEWGKTILEEKWELDL